MSLTLYSLTFRKLLRRFDDLASNSSALNLEPAVGFETLAYNSTAISQAVSKVSILSLSKSDRRADETLPISQLGSDVSAYCAEVRSSKQTLSIATLSSIAQEIAAVELGKQSARPLEEINALLVQLTADVGTTLATSMESEHVVKRKSLSTVVYRSLS